MQEEITTITTSPRRSRRQALVGIGQALIGIGTTIAFRPPPAAAQPGPVSSTFNSLITSRTYVADSFGLSSSLSDCSTAFNALATLVKNAGGGKIIFQAGETYTFTNSITIDVSYVSLDLNTAKFNFSAIASGNFCTLTTSQGAFSGNWYTNVNRIENGFFQGSGQSSTVNTFVWAPYTSSGTYAADNTLFRQCTFAYCGVVWGIGNGVNFNLAENCLVTNCGTGASVLTNINNGERITLTNVTFTTVTTAITDANISSPIAGVEFVCTNCSFDDCGQILYSTLIHLICDNCHAEQFTDAAIPVSLNGALSAFIWIGGVLILNKVGSSNMTNYFAYCASAVYEGITIADATISPQGFYLPQILVSGTGPTKLSNNILPQYSYFDLSSESTNLIPDGHFASGNIQSWTGSPSGDVAYDGTKGNLANGCIKLTGSAATVTATITRPAVPGVICGISSYIETSGLASHSGTWAINIYAYDSVGNSLGQVCYSSISGSDSASWTLYKSYTPCTTPAGTATIKINLSLTSDGSGSAIAWFDDIFAGFA
jgi:hypothetical protein